MCGNHAPSPVRVAARQPFADLRPSRQAGQAVQQIQGWRHGHVRAPNPLRQPLLPPAQN